jgi:hypothetical protein
MNNNEVDIDHIDPRWEEGRDYQLICGFEKDPKNLREESSSQNKSKSNRFLPWRWSRDEIGVIPEEPGDLSLFLDPDTDEWVLEEFMGSWWYEKTWKTCGPYLGTITGGYVGPLRGRKGPEHPKYGVVESEETRKKKSKASLGKPKGKAHKEKLRKNLQKLAESRKGKPGRKWSEGQFDKQVESLRNQKRYRCMVTGFETTGGALTGYQKARGIDPLLRVRIE